MASLIVKKLSKLPIGTHVEITYEDTSAQLVKIAGIISDSDFEANIEIISDQGDEIVLDYSIVRGLSVAKSIESILKELPVQTVIRFSYGSEENREPNLSGSVLENDNEENIEVKLQSGQEMILNYSVFRSLLIQNSTTKDSPAVEEKHVNEPASGSEHKPEGPPKRSPSPEDILNLSDNRLRDLFASLPRDDRVRLNRAYDKFKYGISQTDREKMTEAANLARATFFDEDERGYDWSREAAVFCASMLRRVNIYDHNVLLTCDCFYEAALVCWKDNDNFLAGVYATIALIEGDAYVDDILLIISN